MVLDSLDAKILEVLQENARVSISDLSKRINLSLSAVSDRLKKLEAGGIIEQYTTILNAKELDQNLQAFMTVNIDGTAGLADFLKTVSESPEIIDCFRVAGGCDYILKLACKDTDALAILVGKIKAIRGVKTTAVNVILNKTKAKYSVAPILQKEEQA